MIKNLENDLNISHELSASGAPDPVSATTGSSSELSLDESPSLSEATTSLSTSLAAAFSAGKQSEQRQL